MGCWGQGWEHLQRGERWRGRHTQLLHTVVHQLLFLLLIGDGLRLQLTGLSKEAQSGNSSHNQDWQVDRGHAQSWANPVSGMLPFNVSVPASIAHPGETPHLQSLPRSWECSQRRDLKATDHQRALHRDVSTSASLLGHQRAPHRDVSTRAPLPRPRRVGLFAACLCVFSRTVRAT